MANGSSAYADLGGGINTFLPTPRERGYRSATPLVALDPPTHRHTFEPTSGWCPCGTRDDGQVAEYSPAWRSAQQVDHHDRKGPA